MGKKMNRLSISFVAMAVALSLGFAAPAQAQNADEIMALAKAQWAAQDQNKPAAEAMATVADDYTEFNGGVPVLIEGKALASRFYEGSLKGNDTGVLSEMLNPHVQFYGDVAILSYNYSGLSKDKDGKVTPNNAKSTRIYAKKDGKWMLVHANFAPMAGAD
jgi:ketosteroid isomerase-like protein